MGLYLFLKSGLFTIQALTGQRAVLALAFVAGFTERLLGQSAFSPARG